MAILHFNENVQRQQKSSKSGQPQYSQFFLKWKKGGITVHKILEDPTFGMQIYYFINSSRTFWELYEALHMAQDVRWFTITFLFIEYAQPIIAKVLSRCHQRRDLDHLLLYLFSLLWCGTSIETGSYFSACERSCHPWLSMYASRYSIR